MVLNRLESGNIQRGAIWACICMLPKFDPADGLARLNGLYSSLSKVTWLERTYTRITDSIDLLEFSTNFGLD